MKYCSSCSEPAQNTMVMCAKCGTRNFSDMPNSAAPSDIPTQVNANPLQSPHAAHVPPPNIQGTGAIHGVVPAGWLSSPPTPWRRYAARLLDITVFGFIAFSVIAFVFYSVAPYSADKFFSILTGPGGTIIDLVLTALLGCVLSGAVVGLSGSSLGKLLFGIMVVDKNGNKIGAVQGMQRDISVYLRGLGLGIPLVSFITLWVAYSNLKKTGSASWDTDNDYIVWHRPSGPGQYLLNVIGILLFVVVQTGVRVLGLM